MPACLRCGMELGSGDPAGLCPKCLIQGAFDSSVGGVESGTDTVDEGATPANDDDFGRYRITRQIGEGGMGTVYLAEQRDPIRRLVALKVVKLGMDTAQVLARFNNERQALALMDHPNIARIFDAAATANGRPYFVMEYIEGAPVTQYCDRKRLTINERLVLFLAVCRGVQHAHEKGVIHRDVKPSNVLVTEVDGAPVAKVIDFGIAKATDKWAMENSLLTQFGQIVGTPEYASPEQADTMTGEIDESSDVYSLGVLLYELLIGAVPFDSATLRNVGLAEMLRIIREEEAPSLTRKLTLMGAEAASVAVHRQTDLVSLRRLVSGDLNSIVLKALEKPRERRYASVSDLAADLERHLEHRPVLASPPNRLYRTRKFLRRHKLAVLTTAAALVVLLLSGVTVWSLTRRDPAARPRLTEKDTLVLADFDNKTGDPVFDDTLRQGLVVQLQQSPYLTLIPNRKIQRQLALMGKPKDSRLTPEIAQQICERTSGAAVLDGSIAPLGGQYVLALRATDCNTGNILDQDQAVAARREDVLSSLSEMSRKFRARVGESLATVEKHSTPLAEATTPSLEALKAYSTAMKIILSQGNFDLSVPFLRRAVELDPAFAMAYAQLGLSTGAEPLLSAEYTAKAWRLRDRVSDPERFFIDFMYHRQVTGNLEDAYQTLELWSRTYPRGEITANPKDLLGGLTTQGTGRFQETIETILEGISIDPDFPISYFNLAQAYYFTDRFPEAQSTLQRASARKLEMPQFYLLGYNMAVIAGERDQMERQAGLARKKGISEQRVSHEEAAALARSGRLTAARQSSNRAVDLALKQGAREEAATFRAARAVWEALFGNAAEAKTGAVTALKLSKGRDVEYAAGLALAFSGDPSRPEALAADLEKRYPEDTFVKFTYAPVLHALAAQSWRGTADSMERLDTTRPYELAVNSLNFPQFSLGGLHSAYIRGQAFIAARRYGEAVTEFQKILTHRGIVGLDPIGALAHLQLGRTLALSGDKVRAKAAYQDFFTLWKDADPDIPVLKQAKAEYARL